MNKMQRAVFLDRDGVIINQVEYLKDPNDVELIPGVVEALRLIHGHGDLAVVVSNQSGIARGRFSLIELERIQREITTLLAAEGEKLDGFYFCPHDPLAEKCSCRKPLPGMLLKAAVDLNIDLSKSIMIGDRPSDLEAGFAAGCHRCFMVKTGYGMKSLDEAVAKNYNIEETLLAAVREIYRESTAE